MAFEPRTRDEHAEAIAARVVASTNLTDLRQGGVLLGVVGAVAEQLESVGYDIKGVKDSFSFEGKGRDLDERVAELPGGVVERLGPVAASSTAMRVDRTDTAGPLVVAAGTTYGSTTKTDVLWIQVEDITIPAGRAFYPDITLGELGIRVVATGLGDVGNAIIGEVNRLVSGATQITSATNINAVTGGIEREEDDRLRRRAKAYINSLAKCQRSAIEFLALTFQASDGTRARHVSLFEDLERPGYAEVVVDDGNGFLGFTRLAIAATAVVPVGGTKLLFFDNPAVTEVETITVNAVPQAPSPPQWTSIAERGIVVLQDTQAIMVPGDTWEIGGHSVFTGFIAELQDVLEGSTTSPEILPGWRPLGGRTRVIPPNPENLAISLQIFFETGAIASELIDPIKTETVDFMATIAPGDPFFRPQLQAQLMKLDGVRSANVLLPTSDVQPVDSRAALRTTSALVEVS